MGVHRSEERHAAGKPATTSSRPSRRRAGHRPQRRPRRPPRGDRPRRHRRARYRVPRPAPARRRADRVLHAYHLIAQWFPKVGVLELPGERGATTPRWNCHEFHLFSEFYADFGNYRAELTAPKDFLVRATGVEQGGPQRERGGPHAHLRPGRRARLRVDRVERLCRAARRASYDGPGSPHVDVEVLYPPEYAESARERARRGPSTRCGTSPRRSGRTPTLTSPSSCLRSMRRSPAGWSTRRSSRPSAATGSRRGHALRHRARVRARVLHGPARLERVRRAVPRRGNERDWDIRDAR